MGVDDTRVRSGVMVRGVYLQNGVAISVHVIMALITISIFVYVPDMSRGLCMPCTSAN